jgi:hypothetical protein
MDGEAEYLGFLGMKEHRAASATRVINRVIARHNSRWSVDKMANRGRGNDRETYLWVHGSLSWHEIASRAPCREPREPRGACQSGSVPGDCLSKIAHRGGGRLEMTAWREEDVEGVARGSWQKGRHAVPPFDQAEARFVCGQAEITATILCVRGSRIRMSSPTRM